MIGGAAMLALGAGAAASGGDAQPGAEPTTSVTDTPTTTSEHIGTVATPPPPTTTTAPPETAPPTTVPAPVTFTVIGVVDGDTIDVATSDGSVLTVRLIGIDAPERGACEADAATWALASLVDGQEVALTAGGDGEDTDRYGRLLRYVDIAGTDAGLRLVEDGVAIARYDSRDGYGAHDREAAYVAADDASSAFVCPTPTTQAPATTPLPPPPPPPPSPVFAAPEPAQASGCDPNYTGCVPIDSDVDCAGGSGNGPSYTGYVQVIGSDIYDLDRDGDGDACE